MNKQTNSKSVQTQQLKQKRPRVEQQEKKQNILKKKRKVLSFQGDQEEALVVEQKPVLKQFTRPLEKYKSAQDEIKLVSKLQEQFLRDSQKKGEQLFELEYTYWMSNQIVKKLKRKKREKIVDLLDACRLDLIPNFQNLAKISAEQLLFVIKDFIVPHNMSIHQIQLLNIKTKTGEPILNFHKASMKRQGKQLDIFVNIGQPLRIIEKAKYQKSKTVYPFVNWHTLQIQK